MQSINFVDPDNDLHVNFATSVLVIQQLAKNRRGKKVLDLDKFGVFMFLVSHPTILNRFIDRMGGSHIYLEDTEVENIRAMNPNTALVLNREKVISLLQQLVLNGLVTVNKREEVMIELSEYGNVLAEDLSGWFLDRTRIFVSHLKQYCNEPTTKILGVVIKCFKD